MPPLQPQHQCDVLLVTVTDVETRSLLDVAKTQTNRDYTTLTGKHKTYLDLGEIGGVRVFAVRSEMASSTMGGSLVTVKDAIAEVKPSAVIMVGIAFGVNEEKQNIGDILVSQKLQHYELQRVGTTKRGNPKITLRGDKAHCSAMLLDRLQTTHLQWNKSPVDFGLVLSGEKLIDNVDFRNELLSLSEETIGGEMEGGGLYVACQQNKVDWILVKAICDWADGKKGEGKKEKQKLAATNAAEFVIAMLRAELLTKSPAGSSATLTTASTQQTGNDNLAFQNISHSTININIGATTNPQSQTHNPEATPSEPDVYISRLPDMLTNDLFGRETELQMLNDAWANQETNVFVFVAFGGSGKSALVNHWVHEKMAKENYRGAACVYAWSFWSQGSDQPQTSADPFIDAALRWFGDADPTAGLPWDKGERLARLIKQSRTLLILDGLEPLQHPRATMEGRLKEQSMQALLKELAGGQPGLCVISTREHVADLRGFNAPAVIAHDLEQLSPAAGASILHQQKIKGTEEELQQASIEFGNHALALTILASFLRNAYDGDVRRRKEIGPLTESLEHGGHARRVMSSYEMWLRDAGEGTLLAVLRVLGLFNRPADAASLAALRASPAIPDLTEALLPLSESQWKDTLAKLRRLKLLTDSSTNDEVDAHPLLREHFRDQLQRELPAAWQAGNLRLYEHLTRITETAKEFPDTLEEMQPLFDAVMHGCAAGLQQQALDDVFLQRIRRGNKHFSVKELGGWGTDLAALRSFFAESWQEPSSALTQADQAFVLHEVGSDLRALGRLQDAVPPMQASLNLFISLAPPDWKQASRIAGNLSELTLTLGQLSQSLDFARQSVECADRSRDDFQRMRERTTLGSVLHQAGCLLEAAAEFQSAEALLRKWHPNLTLLYSIFGFRYCELLLSQERFQNVQIRAIRSLELDRRSGDLLSIPLDQLALGCAYLGLARQAADTAQSKVALYLAQAVDCLDSAVDGLRQSGQQDELPRGFLAHAAWARVARDYDLGQRDLAEAFAIAERGEMRLHLCDYHLESARLHLAQGHTDEARSHWETARKMVDEMGYHRRDAEVAELKAALLALGLDV